MEMTLDTGESCAAVHIQAPARSGQSWPRPAAHRESDDVGPAGWSVTLITAPQLEACTLTVSSLNTIMANACAFLKKNAHGLRFLRLIRRELDAFPLNYIHDLVHLCPRLEAIHLLIYYTETTLHRNPHPTLKTLILDRTFVTNLSQVLDHWKINDDDFANFDTVVLALGLYESPLATKADILRFIQTDPRLFAVTCIITQPHCSPVIIPPCATKDLAAKCARDPLTLAKVSARRSNISNLL
ncbi:hypothetical protein PIIN_04803 [Serendipita indica DSM 11827]|uniref:Uncharacterized protein n=1 Tax=Serendipita indica (strain DSM 11827) TaxID=1109443 RepID=G4THS2_SERID|nr:hypothetical protein PIIN_04803 [Serendipita indica DSM 11827]